MNVCSVGMDLPFETCRLNISNKLIIGTCIMFTLYPVVKVQSYKYMIH